MILYLILIVVFGLIILVSVGLAIFGIINKRKNLLVTSAILLTIGVIGCIFSALTYTKKAIEYVKSKEFQEDTKKGSELIGQTVGSATSGISNGLSKTLDDEAIKNLASKSATILSKITKTVASNLDSTLGHKNIFLDKTLENSGLELGRADEKYNAKTNDLGIFIDYKNDFKGKLRITNFDQTGQKIEVVDKIVNAKAGQNKVVVFSFLHSDLGLTTYYIISKPE